ncbi:MAG: GTPase Era [Patescibacteria group bacterium]
MKSGFVVLIGRSNVGKSTLMNTLVGTKISAVTHKPQTTRQAIHGVLNRPEGQIIFVDTPGVFKNAGGALTKTLTKTVEDSLEGVDVILYVVDPTRAIGPEERATLAMVRKIEQPKILVINKIDMPERDKPFLEDYRALADEFAGVFELAALRARHVEPLIQHIYTLLPESESAYPEGQKTNITDYVWIAEIIREKIFLLTEQEVPYSTHVEVDSTEERNEHLVITARILTTEPRYKKMLIGHGGKKIKEIGMAARRELEASTNKKIYLDLQVEVDAHWVERLG